MQLPVQRTFLLLGTLIFLLFSAISVSAGPVTFIAGTTGSFGAGSTGGTVGGGGTTLTVGGTTVTFTPGSLNVGLELPPGLSSSTVNLGKLGATSSALSTFDGGTFTLNVTFTVPGDVSPTPGVYNASVTGKINATASNAQVVWSPTTLTFNSSSIGSFTLTLEPFTPIDAPGNAPHDIRAVITYNTGPAQVPEPMTLMTLGSGLAGLATMLRRRNKK